MRELLCKLRKHLHGWALVKEENTCMSHEEEHTCMSHEEEHTCMSHEEEDNMHVT